MAEARSISRGPLQPGSRIAILGGGQLGRMLAVAAARLGFHCHCYSDGDDNPAFDVVARSVRGSYQDVASLAAFVEGADVLTFEFENVPVEAVRAISGKVAVSPSVRALEVSQDRLVEKRFVQSCGLGVAPFIAVDSAGDLVRAMADLGGPGILKTRRLGYDGKGQVGVSPGCDATAALAAIGNLPAIVEQRIAFEREVSVIVVRSALGETRTYDVPHNTHEGGILRRSVVPSGLPPAVEDEARRLACRIADALDYVGVLAVEMFYLGVQATTPLLVNEMAPRVHNSGHWTMDACVVDQFENHIRAIAGWPLGDTSRLCDAEMINLIGDDVAGAIAFAGEPGSVLHLYGKRASRPGRKMGHVNRLRPGASGPSAT